MSRLAASLSGIESNIKLSSDWEEPPLVEKAAIALNPGGGRLASCSFRAKTSFLKMKLNPFNGSQYHLSTSQVAV